MTRLTRIDDDTVELNVSTKGCMADPFHRKTPERVTVRVQHHDGYGVLVVGTADPVVGRRALRKVGYEGGEGFGYRPYLPAGTPRPPGGAICFFFEPTL